LGGDAMDHRLAHGHAGHLTDHFVVQEAGLFERCRRQAPPLAAAHKHYKHQAGVHPALQPFKYEKRAEGVVAKHPEQLGCLLVVIDYVVIW